MTETTKTRCDELFNLEMVFNGRSYVGNHDKNVDFNVHWTEIITLDDEEWGRLITKLSKEFNDRIA